MTVYKVEYLENGIHYTIKTFTDFVLAVNFVYVDNNSINVDRNEENVSNNTQSREE